MEDIRSGEAAGGKKLCYTEAGRCVKVCGGGESAHDWMTGEKNLTPPKKF